MQFFSRHIPILTLSLTLCACSFGVASAQEIGEVVSAANTQPAVPDLSGTWAQLQVQSAVSSIPVIGDITSDTRSISLMSVVQEGSQLKVVSRACSIEISSATDQVRTIVPDAMIKALGQMSYTAEIRRSRTGWEFHQPATVIVLGAKLKKPWTDPLPEWSRDFRVRDVDGDGEPGVTIRVEGLIEGSIYLVQRSWTQLTGAISNRSVAGQIRWKTDQSILGASSNLLKNGPDARPNPDKARSFFRMVPIPASTTCNDLTKQTKTLFGS